MYYGSHKQLKIKKEFKNLIRPLHQQEYLQLEENILKDGCLDPIITWNGYIVDGHNRYEICTKHDIPFNTVEIAFECDEEVIAWICANQLGRRNISNETRRFLIGMQYETEKILQSKKNPNGLNQYSDSDDLAPGDIEKMQGASVSTHKTAERIADENHVSTATVQKYAIYTRALETIGSKEPELVPKILSGRYKISHNNIVEMSHLSAEELSKINQRLNRRKNPYLQYSKSRNAIQNNPQALIKNNSPSVKQMPEFDPDAEVTELTLTMSSWISSINRTKVNANLAIISETAKTKLISSLHGLESTINEMLNLLKEAE
ncbi:MAG: hypothetical protein K5768_09175 [Firmicutes bacterium]|jgi:hypothetical protein|nr:hypothetical protein [Bacillota bacterium]